jgi:polar amino acid transport system substrate-binding protein
LPEQGLFTELVKTALAAADPGQAYEISFVNDWNAHVADLFPSGDFDMGFPWVFPDCNRGGALDAADADFCERYIASVSFFEAVVGYYTLKGSPYENAGSVSELAGARICRPEGRDNYLLETAGLVPPAIELQQPLTGRSCWRLLLNGDVDVVTYDTLPAEADIARGNLEGQVAEISRLSSLVTMHVIAPKSNPNARDYMDKLDAGLAMLRADGRWFDIVARHLGAHAEATRN